MVVALSMLLAESGGPVLFAHEQQLIFLGKFGAKTVSLFRKFFQAVRSVDPVPDDEAGHQSAGALS